MDQGAYRDSTPPLEVRPEPGAARAAIEAALAARREADAAGARDGAWWRAGVEESVRGDLERD